MRSPETVSFRSYALAFAVVLAPAILQVSCEGDTTLVRLEVHVDGIDRIVCFSSSNRNYEFSTRADDATLTIQTTQAGASAVFQWLVDGTIVDAGAADPEGDPVSLSIPDGASVLRIKVTAVEGNPDEYDVNVTKLDSPLAWSAPQTLVTWPRLVTNAGPRIGIDDAGDAVVVWSQSNGTVSNVYAARFVAGTWSAPELLETDDTGSALTPAIAVEANGDAIAVWSQDTAFGNDEIHANRLVSGVWSGSEVISAVAGFDPQVAFAPNGQAVAVWQERIASQKDIRASRFDSGTWGTTELLQQDFAESPQIAIADNGDAVAVWQRRLGPSSIDPYANRLVSGTWSGAELLELTSPDANDIQIALSPLGDGVAIWEQSNVLSSKRLVSGTWLFPGGQLAAGTATARTPRIAVSDNGDAVAVWDEGLSIYANRILASVGGWEGPTLLATAGAGSSNAGQPRIGVDAQGDGVAMYSVIECPNSATTYTTEMTSGTWSVPERLGSGAGGEVAVNPNGDAVAVWFGLTDTEYSLQVSHRSPTP